MPLTAEQDAFIYEMQLLMYSLETSLFAALTPEPTEQEIEREADIDRRKNPRNETHQPRRRTIDEIVAHIKFRKAVAMRKVKNELNI